MRTGFARPKEQKDRAMELVDEGMRVADISREMDIPPNTISHWLKQDRLPKEPKPQNVNFIDNKPKFQVAEIIGRTYKIGDKGFAYKWTVHGWMKAEIDPQVVKDKMDDDRARNRINFWFKPRFGREI